MLMCSTIFNFYWLYCSGLGSVEQLRNQKFEKQCDQWRSVLVIYAELLGTDLTNMNDPVDLASELKLI